MDNKLLTISEFIKEARRQGASFDDKDAKVHLVYLTKLGLLPSASKKKVNGEIHGCYPSDSINRLLEIQQMKTQGITYSQMSKTVIPTEGVAVVEGSRLTPLGMTIHIKPSNFAYLMLGLVIGVLVSTLNTSGLNAMNKVDNLSLKENVGIENTSDKSNVYLIQVPKTSLDKLDKTNINYLIRN